MKNLMELTIRAFVPRPPGRRRPPSPPPAARALLLCLALWPGAGVYAAPARCQQSAPVPSAAARAKAEIPADLTRLDARALIREVAESERAMQPRRLEYTWTAKVTDRELGKRGEVKRETVKVYEVYPVRGEFIRKLTSENGVPVSPEEAEKQFKKTVANLEKAAREEEKRGGSPPPRAATDANGIPTFGFSNGFKFREGLSAGEFSFAPWRALRAGEFFAPRRESLGGREMIVLDFRPRADFIPANDLQKPYAKLGGRVWIDVADRALARLEAWPLKQEERGAPAIAAAAPLARPDEPSIIYAETRLADGMWLESLVRINTVGSKSVFNGVEVNTVKEVWDFKRFAASAGDAKVESPKQP